MGWTHRQDGVFSEAMKLFLHACGALLLTTFVLTTVAVGCEATKQRPPKQAQDAPLQQQKYGDQRVDLEPGAEDAGSPATK